MSEHSYLKHGSQQEIPRQQQTITQATIAQTECATQLEIEHSDTCSSETRVCRRENNGHEQAESDHSLCTADLVRIDVDEEVEFGGDFDHVVHILQILLVVLKRALCTDTQQTETSAAEPQQLALCSTASQVTRKRMKLKPLKRSVSSQAHNTVLTSAVVVCSARALRKEGTDDQQT